MTPLDLIPLFAICGLIGIALAHLLTQFVKRMQIVALRHYRDNRRHVRWMKRSRERRARLRLHRG
jgi:hypothetical protein